MVTSLDSTSSSPKSNNTIKFLCSYNGKILPRHPDGVLRYVGGETRVLAVDRSISFPELLVKMGELNGSSVSLRCQLPEEDLDALVSITSDEDLGNVIEEYDLASQKAGSPLKIKTFFWAPKSTKRISPPSSAKKLSPPPSAADSATGKYFYNPNGSAAVRRSPAPIRYPSNCFERPSGTKMCYYGAAAGVFQANPWHHTRPVHNGNHWQ